MNRVTLVCLLWTCDSVLSQLLLSPHESCNVLLALMCCSAAIHADGSGHRIVTELTC